MKKWIVLLIGCILMMPFVTTYAFEDGNSSSTFTNPPNFKSTDQQNTDITKDAYQRLVGNKEYGLGSSSSNLSGANGAGGPTINQYNTTIGHMNSNTTETYVNGSNNSVGVGVDSTQTNKGYINSESSNKTAKAQNDNNGSNGNGSGGN